MPRVKQKRQRLFRLFFYPSILAPFIPPAASAITRA